MGNHRATVALRLPDAYLLHLVPGTFPIIIIIIIIYYACAANSTRRESFCSQVVRLLSVRPLSLNIYFA